MILVEVSLVFSMKPVNTKAPHSVNTYTSLACTLPEVLSLCSSLFSLCYVCPWGYFFIFFKDHELLSENNGIFLTYLVLYLP